MLRLVTFAIVVALIFIHSPQRKPEPALDGLATSTGAVGAALAAAHPASGLEAALLAEAARQAARTGIESARRALVPPARP